MKTQIQRNTYKYNKKHKQEYKPRMRKEDMNKNAARKNMRKNIIYDMKQMENHVTKKHMIGIWIYQA